MGVDMYHYLTYRSQIWTTINRDTTKLCIYDCTTSMTACVHQILISVKVLLRSYISSFSEYYAKAFLDRNFRFLTETDVPETNYLLNIWATKSESTPSDMCAQRRSDHPVSILHKSIAGRYWSVRVADGPIKARCRFIKNACWAASMHSCSLIGIVTRRFLISLLDGCPPIGTHVSRYVFSLYDSY